jgi:hypothetical protein
MLGRVDAENIEGDDDDEDFRGVAPLYPSAPTSRLLMKEADHPWIHL